MPRPNRVVTLQSVAEHAGVSLKTASNAVNGTGRMGDDTRTKVLAAVEELGYKVNVAARNLTRGRTDAIALAVPTLKAPYLAELAENVVEAARARGLTAYVTTFGEGFGPMTSRAYLEQFNVHFADGLLLSMAEHEQLTPADLDVDYPLVCLGSRDTFGFADHVTTDDIADARTATEYLLSRGCTSIAVVGAHHAYDPVAISTATEGNAEQRLRGISEALASAGRRLDGRLVGVSGYVWSISAGFRAATAVIDSGIPFDGLICLSDTIAIGAVFALRERGIRIPEDVQVMGFDNIAESAYLVPPLTTMSSQLEWIAPTAIDLLRARIDGNRADPALHLALSDIVVRSTTR
ncbi:LacI family DNA-binding transcriptional regulator [Microbacterium sp. GXS0129]|uniref:LacI family DNA-binding transcriptional regulator n=1 Tax=Microbacterium sp. GXS0129 TaxID=3377836 RepID=UPI00383B0423